MRVAGRRSGALTPLEEDRALDLEEHHGVTDEEEDDDGQQRHRADEGHLVVVAEHAAVGLLDRWLPQVAEDLPKKEWRRR